MQREFPSAFYRRRFLSRLELTHCLDKRNTRAVQRSISSGFDSGSRPLRHPISLAPPNKFSRLRKLNKHRNCPDRHGVPFCGRLETFAYSECIGVSLGSQPKSSERFNRSPATFVVFPVDTLVTVRLEKDTGEDSKIAHFGLLLLGTLFGSGGKTEGDCASDVGHLFLRVRCGCDW